MSGVPELVVLRLLTEREMYGYELVKGIRLLSKETIALAEGVVYPMLYSLEAQGALRSRKKIVNGRERIYYTATAKGKRRLTALLGEWQRVNSGIKSILGAAYE